LKRGFLKVLLPNGPCSNAFGLLKTALSEESLDDLTNYLERIDLD